MIDIIKNITLPNGVTLEGNGNISIGLSQEECEVGMMIVQTTAPSQYDTWMDMLMANDYQYFREIPTYQTTGWVDASKAALLRNIPEGAKYIWGVSCNRYDNPAYVITPETWPDFKQAILDAAQWAQDNGVHEFQIGNEEEYHSAGPDEATVNWVIDRMLEVAPEVKQIFTNGKVSYSCIHEAIGNWVAKGKGNIDILYSNVYYRYNDVIKWQSEIDTLVNAFGDECGLTEFGVQGASDAPYWANLDESQQTVEIQEMIDYCKSAGLKRIICFVWHHGSIDWGIVRMDQSGYRQVWNSVLKDINK